MTQFNPFLFTTDLDNKIRTEFLKILELPIDKKTKKIVNFERKYANIVDHIDDIYLLLKDDVRKVINKNDHILVELRNNLLIFVKTAPMERYCFFIPTLGLYPLVPPYLIKGRYFIQGNIFVETLQRKRHYKPLYKEKTFILGNHKIKVNADIPFNVLPNGNIILKPLTNLEINALHDYHGYISYKTQCLEYTGLIFRERQDRHINKVEKEQLLRIYSLLL